MAGATGVDSRAKELIERGDSLFSKKQVLNSLHQEIADHFYPERADFTIQRYLGNEFAANLTTSYPVLVRRELHNLIGGMLRSDEMDWFENTIMREDKLDKAGKEFLQRSSKTQKRAMYDQITNLQRSANQTDGDFVTFGNGVMQLQHNKKANALLYHNRHLRDCAWHEGIEGTLTGFHRKWDPPIKNAIALLKDNPDAKIPGKWGEVRDQYATTAKLRHVIIAAEDYDTGTGPNGKRYRTKWVSVWVDEENKQIVLEEPSVIFQYIVPRWQLVSGSQYGFSPCTVAGLPDARLLQQMTLTILEAGEKAANPPIIATQDVVRSDVNTYSGGITWLDRDYDEKMGEGLRVMAHDYSGMPIGDKLQESIRAQLKEAFYLNKISMPPAIDAKEMTAFEVGQRVQEYVRNALPLFTPMETDYNGQLCRMSFDLLMAHGAFGSIWDMPQSVRGQEPNFTFRSTLHDTVKKQRGPTFAQAKAMIADAMAIDPAAAQTVKLIPSIKWALEGLGYPEELMNSDEDIKKIAAKGAQQQQLAQTMTNLHAGAQTAQQIGAAAQSFKDVQQ